jgi:hypothetical protein
MRNLVISSIELSNRDGALDCPTDLLGFNQNMIFA